MLARLSNLPLIVLLFGMGALAMIPPLWRRRMNPRVRQWRKTFYPEITDWKPYTKAANPLPR